MQPLIFKDALRRPHPLDDAIPTAVLKILSRAHRYAVRAGMDDWDFAVEVSELRRAHISNSDLRWLLSQNLVKCANEMTSEGKRRFLHAPIASISSTSCFVITEDGLELLESLSPSSQPATILVSSNGVPPLPLLEGEKPVWDPNRRKLLVRGQIIKHFRCPAPNQQVILDVFQATHWPTHVADPLPHCTALCPKRRLHDAIKRLNRHHLLSAIRFSGDGSGRGVLWELIT